jgi:peptidoglycan-associated lipoprotein
VVTNQTLKNFAEYQESTIEIPYPNRRVTMKTLTKTLILALICAGMVACKSKEPAPEPTPEPVQEPTPPPVEVAPVLDPMDYSNPENFTNDASLLSRRVIYFDYDESSIKAEYREILAAHAQFLSHNSNFSATLEGHADERGTREYNLALGERRGNGVMSVLGAGGGASSQLSVVSYGEERPIANCTDESCWSRNRRVEIVYPRH